METMDMTANTPAVEDTAIPQSVPQEIATAPEGAAVQKDPPALVKKIGNMTYIVRVHFSTTSKETFSDKVKRLLRQEVRQMMESEAANE